MSYNEYKQDVKKYYERVLSEYVSPVDPEYAFQILSELISIAAEIDKININLCSYESFCNSKWYNEKSVNIRTKARNMVAMLGLNCEITGDPRGAAIKIILPSGRYNSFGGEGWIVPYPSMYKD